MTAFLKKHRYILTIVAILLLATFLRFYKLGQVPHGMYWDEAAVGYNGYSVLTTRRDEWLEKLPISFRSFGDYKAPLGVYLNGPFTYFLGMNLFAVRVPFALSSLVGILGLILLTYEVFEKNKYRKYYSVLAGFLMTLSPWTFFYSRIGFDNGFALALVIWGLYLFVFNLKRNFKNILSNFLMALFFGVSIYAYHTTKVVVPVLLIYLFIKFRKVIFKNLKNVFLPIGVFLISLVPFIYDSFAGEGLTRAGVTILTSSMSFWEKISYILNGYLIHLSPGYLIFGNATSLRHTAGYMGVFYITTIILVVFGLASLFIKRKRKNDNSYENNFHFVFVALIFIGLLPACISAEMPHSSRSSLAYPGFILSAIFGLDFLVKKLKKVKINHSAKGSKGENDIVVKSAVGLFLIVHILLAISYFNHYFTVFAKDSADAFQDGYIEVMELAKKYEYGDGVGEVEKIVFSTDYGQPYIYALFVRKTNPIEYHGGSLIKYEFKDDVNEGDLLRNNTLVVGSKDDHLPTKKADYLIYGSDGEVKFQVFVTDNTND